MSKKTLGYTIIISLTIIFVVSVFSFEIAMIGLKWTIIVNIVSFSLTFLIKKALKWIDSEE